MGKKNKLELKKKRKEKFVLKKSLKKSLKNSGYIKLSNLPYKITEKDVEDFLKDCGEIEYVILHKKKNGKYNGSGTVKFSETSSAHSAVEKCSGTNLMGRNIAVSWATKNPNELTKSDAEKMTKNLHLTEERGSNIDEKSVEVKEEIEDNDSEIGFLKGESSDGQSHSEKRSSKLQSKISKLQRKIRVGRIIVRNLSFQITEEKLEKFFEPFGEIVEIKLLKKYDKFVGCGFVQFTNKKAANQAITETNGKELLGRPVICDWALPKHKYMKYVEEENSSKAQEDSLNDILIKQEPCSDSETENDKSNIDYDSDVECVKDEDNLGDDYEEKKVKRELSDSECSDEEDDDDYDDDMNDSNTSDEDSKRSNNKKGKFSESKKPKVISNDVSEGRTVFVKNIPFSATNDDLRKCMVKFGPVHYALICIDELTEHSKGTGFVKFQKLEDSQKCLEASTELTIDGEPLQVYPALPRDGIKSLHERKKEKKIRDNRHLYLVKEGVIVAGTPAARGVSVADMEKRLSLEQWKTQMLRNLNMFVSNTRLVVYNVPLSWTDHSVLKLCKEHGGKGARITEARIMRDMRSVDEKGVGKSKQYAFVRFTQHEHALKALRSLNNNPSIFSPHKRPIVSFSIENKAIHKVKENRIQKSKLALMKKKEELDDSAQTSQNRTKQLLPKQHKRNNTIVGSNAEKNVGTKSFSGLVSEHGSRNVSNNFLRRNAVTHQESVKKQKNQQKKERRMKIMKEKIRDEPMCQPKKKFREKDESFSRLVSEYKAKLGSFETQKKWYQ